MPRRRDDLTDEALAAVRSFRDSLTPNQWDAYRDEMTGWMARSDPISMIEFIESAQERHLRMLNEPDDADD